MEERININVSAPNYEKSSDGISSILRRLEEMVHEEDGFVLVLISIQVCATGYIKQAELTTQKP